jgi:hypothetical protein
LSTPRSGRLPVGEIDDFALVRSIDCRVRVLYEAFQCFGMPMVTARLASLSVHALLHDRPSTVVGHNEAM